MAKIYVGNLPFSADEAAVRTLFAQHGTVESVALPTDRETGRPRGFGFVEMPQADAARAIQALNGYSMGGRPLRVNEAQDKPRTGGGGGGGGGYRGGGGGGGGGGRGGYGGGGGGGGGGRW
ncbi:MAG: RNA-binding protein [Steroidobacteraceae bacterium]